MSDFEWQTEDDYDWDNEQSKLSSPTNPRRRWLLPLVLTTLVAIVGYVVYSQVQTVVKTTTQTTEQQVRGAFTTLYRAAAENDIELFNSLLSGRDDEWTTQQQQRFGDNLLLNRDALGFTLLDTEPTIGDIELDPDLQGAIVTATARYAVRGNAGLTETLTLAIPSIYRRGDNQWLYAPPLPEFWGETQTHYTDNLRLSYPMRDVKIVGWIGTQLDDALTEICALNGQSPCTLTPWEIDFITTTSALELPEPSLLRGFPYQETLTFTLPTPSLIGLPQSDIGQQALVAAYARHIFPSLIAQMTQYPCCDQQEYMEALIAVQLREVGLLGWSLSAEDYATIARTHGYVGDSAWQKSGVQQEALALIEFLWATYSIGGRELAAEFRGGGGCNCPIRYLNQLTLGDGDAARLSALQTKAFVSFLVQKSTPPLTASIYPTNILFGCSDLETQTSHLLRYDSSTDSYEQVADFPAERVRLVSLAHDEAVWVTQGDGNGSIYRDGEFIPIEGESEVIGFFRPNSTQSLLYSPHDTFKLIDTAACADGNCPQTTLPGFPIWSPDGKYALMMTFGESGQAQLFEDNKPIRTINSEEAFDTLFWLDNERFVLADNLNLFVQTIKDDTLQSWLTPEDFFQFLGEDALNGGISGNSPFNARIVDETLLLYTAIPRTSSTDRSLLAIDIQTKAMRLIRHTIDEIDWISPRTHSQTVTIYNYSGSQTNHIHFLDIVTGESISAPIYDDGWFPASESWSGDWVLVMDEGFGRIIQPTTQTVEYIFPPSHCTSAAWYSGN